MQEMAGIRRGRSIEASPEWVALALETMRQRGISQQDLCALVGRGVDDGTISRFLKPQKGKPHVSRWANEIADALKLPRPYILISSADEVEWHNLGRLARRLSKERYRDIVRNIRIAVGAAATVEEADAAVRHILEPPTD